MHTRREILVGTIAAGAVMRTRTGFAKAAQPATPLTFDVPAGGARTGQTVAESVV